MTGNSEDNQVHGPTTRRKWSQWIARPMLSTSSHTSVTDTENVSEATGECCCAVVISLLCSIVITLFCLVVEFSPFCILLRWSVKNFLHFHFVLIFDTEMASWIELHMLNAVRTEAVHLGFLLRWVGGGGIGGGWGTGHGCFQNQNWFDSTERVCNYFWYLYLPFGYLTGYTFKHCEGLQFRYLYLCCFISVHWMWHIAAAAFNLCYSELKCFVCIQALRTNGNPYIVLNEKLCLVICSVGVVKVVLFTLHASVNQG